MTLFVFRPNPLLGPECPLLHGRVSQTPDFLYQHRFDLIGRFHHSLFAVTQFKDRFKALSQPRATPQALDHLGFLLGQ